MAKKIPYLILRIVFFVCAGVLAIYAIWSFAHCADIISQAKAAGQLSASGNEYDIASFYMGNCGQFFVFALLLLGAGLLMQRIPYVDNDNNHSIHSVKNEAVDIEMDEWFEGEEQNEITTLKDA